MTVEDFTSGWTETDPDSEITVTSTGDVTLTNPNEDGGGVLYKALSQDGFVYQFKLTIDAFVSSGYMDCFIQQNSSGGFSWIPPFNCLTITTEEVTNGDYLIYTSSLGEDPYPEDSDASVGLDFNTTYYITWTRAAGTNTLDIDTGSYGGSSVDTLTWTDDQSTYSYLAILEEPTA